MLRDFFDRSAAVACKKSLCPAKNGALGGSDASGQVLTMKKITTQRLHGISITPNFAPL
jgi:hypothetical protein